MDLKDDEGDKSVLFLGGSSFSGLSSANMLDYFYDITLTYYKSQIPAYSPEFFWIYCDLSSIQFELHLRKMIKHITPHFIVNFASVASPAEAKKFPSLSYQLNVIPNKIIIKICKEFDIYPILISTDHVFDGITGRFSEKTLLNPIRGMVYGEQKATAESYFLPLVEVHRAAIIRMSTALGVSAPYQRLNIYSKVAQALINNQSISGAIDKYRTPFHIYNLGFLLNYIMSDRARSRSSTENTSNIFHIPGEYLSEYDLFIEIAKSLDADPSLIKPYEMSKTVKNYPLNAGLTTKKDVVRYLTLKEGLYQLNYIIKAQNESASLS